MLLDDYIYVTTAVIFIGVNNIDQQISPSKSNVSHASMCVRLYVGT